MILTNSKFIFLGCFGALLTSITMFSIMLSTHVSAASNWGEGENVISEHIPDYVLNDSCESKEVVTAKIYQPSGIDRTADFEACVVHGRDISLASYIDLDGRLWWSIKQSGDDVYRVLEGGASYKLHLVEGSNRLVFYTNGGQFQNTIITSIDDAAESLNIATKTLSGAINSYDINMDKAMRWLGYVNNGETRHMHVYNSAVSDNGRYVLAWVDYSGMVKIDLNERRVQALGTYKGAWFGGKSANPGAGAITDDGNEVFLSGPLVIIDASDNCGYELTQEVYDRREMFMPHMPQCEKFEMSAKLSALTGYNGFADKFKWLDDNNKLQFAFFSYPQSGVSFDRRMVTLSKNIPEQLRLDYLALGDSYSSGEGNVLDGKSNYVEGTDGVGGCHVSAAAYPFVLKDRLLIHEDRMKSVACSGARVDSDYHSSVMNYLGQNGRLASLSEETRATEQSRALTSFAPGNIPQVEFVKKYKPSSITITGGGNDAGFGTILGHCAGIGFSKTCDYAKKGSVLHRQLSNVIAARYESTRKLIREMKIASPSTTIYMVGYPSFIADTGVCRDAALLNLKERKMINYAVRYMNGVLEAAATSEGAYFKNIETSLYGGRICERGSYVTTLSDVDGFLDASRHVEAFHPNAAGHEKMADAIIAAQFSTTPDNNPVALVSSATVPPFFQAKKARTAEDRLVRQALASVRKTLKVMLGSFRTGAQVKLSINGVPFDTVRPVNGAASTKLPSTVKDGYQILSASGTGSDGQKAEVFQMIEVQSGTEKDSDGDGVANAQDSCKYIPSWLDQRTGHRICG